MILNQLFLSQKTYGKQPEQLEAIIPLFNLALSDYPFDKIEDALKFHLKTNNEMPTPADIVSIIERGNKPAFTISMFVTLSKKQPEERTPEEWQYLRDYQNFHVTGRFS